MSTNPAKITLGKSLAEAIRTMSLRHVDYLLVTDDDNKLKGYIDLETINERYSKDASVSDIYNRTRMKFKRILTYETLVKKSLNKDINMFQLLIKTII
jgi:Predicted transcriptional regulator, contains C-terminal CBS domains